MSAFCHSASTLCLSALFGVVCQLSHVIFPYTSENKQVRVGSISGCVLFPTTLLYGWGYDTHSLCVVCLVAKHAESALEAGIYENICQCVCFTFRGFSWEGAFTSTPRGASTAFAETDQRLRLRELQTKPHQFQRHSTLHLSSSEEVDVEDVDKLSKSILFAQARCLHNHIMNYFIMITMSGERADCAFPRCILFHSRQACSEECVHASDLAVRSHCCWDTAAIENTGI